MINRIDRILKNAEKNQKKILSAYLTAGDPDLETTAEIILALEKLGVDIIELGFPFSDPVADGPVIQKSSSYAITQGTNLNKTLELVKTLRAKTEIPIILMGYYNPILCKGLAKLTSEMAKAGADGLIIPDLPFEENQAIRSYLEPQNIHLISLLAPTTPDERMQEIAASSRGFIYCVSVTGVTGSKKIHENDLITFLQRVKKQTSSPYLVGFGIDTPEKAQLAARQSQGVIIGTPIMKIIQKNRFDKKSLLKDLQELIEPLRQAVDLAQKHQ